MNSEKKYTGNYKVIKLFRKSRRREVIQRGLTIEEAQRVVKRYKSSNTSMVIFTKQYWSDKYFI